MRSYPESKFGRYTNVRMSSDMHASLTRLAQERNMTLSDFVRDVLSQYIAYVERKERDERAAAELD